MVTGQSGRYLVGTVNPRFEDPSWDDIRLERYDCALREVGMVGHHILRGDSDSGIRLYFERGGGVFSVYHGHAYNYL